MTPDRAWEIANAILDENPDLETAWVGRTRPQPSANSLRGAA